jgi:hypothetical protein
MVANTLPDWSLAGESINTRGITKFGPALPRYAQQAKHVQAMLCIADTDHRCVLTLRRELEPRNAPTRFLLRFAVSEAESWVLADRQGAADFFQVPLKSMPLHPEEEPDAKRTVLHLAKISKVRVLRNEMISSTDINKPGTGYNLHLCRLVSSAWQPERAAEHSSSLQRALLRLASLAT